MFRLRRRDWIILTAFIIAVAIGYGVYSNWTEEGLRRTEADMKNNLPLRTATFCNVTTGANTSGYGSRGVSTSSSVTASSGVSASSGAGAISPSIPPCSSEPPFNELCN